MIDIFDTTDTGLLAGDLLAGGSPAGSSRAGGSPAGIAKCADCSASASRRSSLAFVAVMMLLASALAADFASPARAEGLPANLVTSVQPSQDTITQYIAQAMIELKSTDPAKQQAGRDAIVNFVAPAPAPVQPSPTFMSIYAQTLNAQLLSVSNSPEMRSRLNAAIAMTRIAEKFDNDKLVPAISAFLNDKNEAVALWALKASKFAAPRGTEGAKLLPLIAATSKRFPSLATAGYQALINAPAPTAAMIDQIHQLMQARIALYAQDVPADPLAELVGMNALVDTQWWKSQNAAQQQQTIQLLTNLSAVAGQRALKNVSTENRESLASLVRLVSRGIGAIAIRTPGKESLAKKMDDATRGLGAASSPQQVNTAATTILAAIQAEFPTLTPPPKIPETNPTPATK